MLNAQDHLGDSSNKSLEGAFYLRSAIVSYLLKSNGAGPVIPNAIFQTTMYQKGA